MAEAAVERAMSAGGSPLGLDETVLADGTVIPTLPAWSSRATAPIGDLGRASYGAP